MRDASLTDCLAEACRLEANAINFYHRQGEMCDDRSDCSALCTIKKCASVVYGENMSLKDDFKGADVWAAYSCEY